MTVKEAQTTKPVQKKRTTFCRVESWDEDKFIESSMITRYFGFAYESYWGN